MLLNQILVENLLFGNLDQEIDSIWNEMVKFPQIVRFEQAICRILTNRRVD